MLQQFFDVLVMSEKLSMLAPESDSLEPTIADISEQGLTSRWASVIFLSVMELDEE